MNYLIARVKDRHEKYRKALSKSIDFYSLPSDLCKHHEYTPDYKLEEDEWYSISNFSARDFCIDLIKNEFDSTAYKLLRQTDPDNVKYLCSIQYDSIYYFQRVFKRNILKKRKVIKLGDEVSIEESTNQISLSDIADAIYVKSDDMLYFRKLETIAPIFKGIEVLDREATDEEISGFLKQSFINTAEQYDVVNVGKANRKRITTAMDRLKTLSPEQINVILKYTNSYYPGLQYDGKTFTIHSEEDMKHLLFGLHERYFTTPATGEKRLANSVSVLNGK